MSGRLRRSSRRKKEVRRWGEVPEEDRPKRKRKNGAKNAKKPKKSSEVIDLTLPVQQDVQGEKVGELVIPFAKGFRRPSSEAVKAAIGSFGPGKHDWDQRRHFVETKSGSEPHFQQIPDCVCIDDWLAQYNEEGQTFKEYIQSVTRRSGQFKVSANAKKKTICLLPIGEFGKTAGQGKKFLEFLQQYTEKFFGGTPVRLLERIRLEQGKSPEELYWVNGLKTNSRRFRLKIRYDKGSRKRQIQIDSILCTLSGIRQSKEFQRLEPDAFCLVGITLEDLYDTNPDLFVAGMAAGGSKVAVFSFYRYDPFIRFSSEFWYKTYPTKDYKDSKMSRDDILLARSCKLIVHEICHLYGIDHCKFYACCMNGSGHLEEDFRQPYYLCPVDLRKLGRRIDFDIKKRYAGMVPICKSNPALREYGEWISSRLTSLYSD